MLIGTAEIDETIRIAVEGSTFGGGANVLEGGGKSLGDFDKVSSTLEGNCSKKCGKSFKRKKN